MICNNSFHQFITPQTDDGVVEEISFQNPVEFTCLTTFKIPAELRERAEKPGAELIFAARSRICRLGISLEPAARVVVDGGMCRLRLKGRLLFKNAGMEKHLKRAFLPGVPVGRLVLCDPARRLSALAVYQALDRADIKLPYPFSLGADGRVHFQPQLCRYRFRFKLEHEHLIAVLMWPDGKELLNFLQIREPVTNIVLRPGEAIITSCAMFLQKHFVVLDTADYHHGQHLQARVLDPLETRMSNVFLEFENGGDQLIVNPAAVATLYEADQCEPKPVYLRKPPTAGRGSDYRIVGGVFSSLSKGSNLQFYSDRPIAIQPGVPPFPDFSLKPVQNELRRTRRHPGTHVHDHTSPRSLSRMEQQFESLENALDKAGKDSFTVFCEYFPNTAEHPALLHAAAASRLKSLVFRKASFEHGPFLSERDQARLNDYAEYGVQIFWHNEIFKHVAVYSQKDRRGFFVSPSSIPRFQDALVLAIYGSTVDLPNNSAAGLGYLLKKLSLFFGNNVAFLTGGGGGVMKLVLETGKKLGVLVGSNFLENADQNLDSDIHFYQTFQSGARHMRQRWFEIARFHLFCIGGVGTLEEVGLTLTDIKLGLINTEPIVLFGSSGNTPYWRSLGEQLKLISAEHRGPKWLETHVLVTDDPDEVLAFYQRILQVG